MEIRIAYRSDLIGSISALAGNCSTARPVTVEGMFLKLAIAAYPTILDKTVGKVSTFEVIIACLPSPLLA